MAKRKSSRKGNIKKGIGKARTQGLVEGIGDWDVAFDYDSDFRF